jgi:hypothetical protein
VSSIHDIAKLASEAGNLHNCIVKLYITTKRSVIGTFTASELEASLRAGWAARHVKIIFNFVSEDVAAPPQIVSDAELWIAYLASKGDNIKVNKDKLLETGLKYIND